MITLVTCIAAYCIICALIIAIVPAVRNNWKSVVRNLSIAIKHKKIKPILTCWIVVGKVFFYAPLLMTRFIKRKIRKDINSLENHDGAGTEVVYNMEFIP